MLHNRVEQLFSRFAAATELAQPCQMSRQKVIVEETFKRAIKTVHGATRVEPCKIDGPKHRRERVRVKSSSCPIGNGVDAVVLTLLVECELADRAAAFSSEHTSSQAEPSSCRQIGDEPKTVYLDDFVVDDKLL